MQRSIPDAEPESPRHHHPLPRQMKNQNHEGASSHPDIPHPPDPPSELDVLLHDGHALGVDGAQVRVLKQRDEEGLGGLLQRHDGLRLPAHRGAGREHVERDLADLGRFLLETRYERLWGGQRTTREKGSFARSRSVDFWYRLISRKATEPGFHLRRARDTGSPAVRCALAVFLFAEFLRDRSQITQEVGKNTYASCRRISSDQDLTPWGS
jgi:hypothetical protein